MPKPNIITFTGRDTFSIEESVHRWIDIFGQKYGEYNITPIDASSPQTDWRSIESEMLSTGLFAEKRLFVMRNLEIKIKKKGSIENEESSEDEAGDEALSSQIEISLTRILDSISDENFLIFVRPSIPKTKKIGKLLDTLSTRKLFDTPYDLDVWEKRFLDLDRRTIAEIIQIYQRQDDPKDPRNWGYQIYHSLLHLSIARSAGSPYSLTDFIQTEPEEIIFRFIDSLTLGRAQQSREIWQSLCRNDNIYALIGGLIANLRTTLYILSIAKIHGSRRVREFLPTTHPFVIEKSLKLLPKYQMIRDFYHEIIEANIAQKSGKGMYKSELGLNLVIELGLLGLQKSKKL